MSQNPGTAVGQVSADGQFRWDGQQWVPIPPGTREPTPWTRPMQLATAGLFAAEAIYSTVTAIVFVNHDTMQRVLRAQGTQITSGISQDALINTSIAITIGTIIFFAILELVAALGSLLGWRWMFWAALVLFALGGLGAIGNISTFASPDRSPFPLAVVAVSELLSLASLALFVWLLVGLIRFGPWAMKRPGA